MINVNNVGLHGYESHSEYSLNRAAIEITGDSTNVTITNMGRRTGSTVFAFDEQGLVSEDFEGRFSLYTLESSMLGLFKSAFASEVAPPPPVNTGTAQPDLVRPLAPVLGIFQNQTVISDPTPPNEQFVTLDGYSFSISDAGSRQLFMDKVDAGGSNIVGWTARTFSNGNHSFAEQRTHRFTSTSGQIRVHSDATLNLQNGDKQYYRFTDMFTGTHYFIGVTIDSNGMAIFEFTKSAY